jgi:hypothetical protein
VYIATGPCSNRIQLFEGYIIKSTTVFGREIELSGGDEEPLYYKLLGINKRRGNFHDVEIVGTTVVSWSDKL